MAAKNKFNCISFFQKINFLKTCKTIFLFVFLFSNAWAVNFTPFPPFLSEIKGTPMVMLNMSRDHQLSYKAYNEYTDLDGDGLPETQYKHQFRYYGYFDNHRCYEYSSTAGVFVPTRQENSSTSTNPTYCGGVNEWHGNFLNWATMTRMDVVRRILYGGMRSTDGAVVGGNSTTILERAYLPTDAHSFAKYYTGADVSLLTPSSFGSITEITICNLTPKNGAYRYSHDPVAAPLLRVVKGNFALWNSNERWQCRWFEEVAAVNNNNSSKSGFNASPISPKKASDALGQKEYIARVEVCKIGLTDGLTVDEQSRCKKYPSGNYKPIGLLQRYGEDNKLAFGLMTGSFSKNKSGGVLRKNIGTFTDEVDVAGDGRFIAKGTTGFGIVDNLDKLRIRGYDYDEGTGNKGTYIVSDNCSYQQTSLTEGDCSSWGNPMGEIYLESIRYLAGKTPTTGFLYGLGSKDASLGLTVQVWKDPYAASTATLLGDPICRKTSVVNFNASVSSYDNDQWASQADIAGFTSGTAEAFTDLIGSVEGIQSPASTWAVGVASGGNDRFCTDKSVAALSSAVGLCPEAPTLSGGYKMAGLALKAHISPIRTDNPLHPGVPISSLPTARAFHVDTYGVALATSTPRIKVPVPNNPGKFVVIQPAFRLDKSGNGLNVGGGTLVDFRIVSQTATSGKYLVQWEDSEQGGDYDQDVWGILEYTVNVGANTITISTVVLGDSTVNPQGFGYILTGVANGKDGVHFHSGIYNFNFTDVKNILVSPSLHINASGGCNNCNTSDAKTSATYVMAGVGSDYLRDPMYYAAKYGGFKRDLYPTIAYNGTSPLIPSAWDANSDGQPDSYFYAIDPSQLEQSITEVFKAAAAAGGSAPAAAISSRTVSGGNIFVATHTVADAKGAVDAVASGEFIRYGFNADGSIKTIADWDAGAVLTSRIIGGTVPRVIFTLSDTSAVPFQWANLSASQQSALRINPGTGAADSVAMGQARLDWLRGGGCNEAILGVTATGCSTPSVGLRSRPVTKLGAIINSSPWYVGAPSAGFSNVDFGGGYGNFRATYASRNTIYVAANDGMLHGFDAASGTELFSYVPRAIYQTIPTLPYSKISTISSKNYSINSGVDSLNVDGSLMAADIQVNSSPSAVWRTYLFGALGRGGKGIYALDVTDAVGLGENVADAAKVVKWEFNDSVDADMGYIVGRSNTSANGQPTQVGRMANGKWAAIYGNGYNSTNGKAALFIIFADKPGAPNTWTSSDYVKIVVNPTDSPLVIYPSSNGLAAPTVLDTNNDGVVDVIYAGDLKGNVWKFDVSDVNPNNWKVATAGAVPIYSATANAVVLGVSKVYAQPVTTSVLPFVHPNGGFQLFFGTGKSLESTDFPMLPIFPQTVYGIYDAPGNTGLITTGKMGLIQNILSSSGGFRYLTLNAVNYLSDKGWYIDLPDASEAVFFNPLQEGVRRVTVRSLAPGGNADGCKIDSNVYDMTLDAIAGQPIKNIIPGAPTLTNLGVVGDEKSNIFEIVKSGTFEAPRTCVAGSPGCSCNPGDVGYPTCQCKVGDTKCCVPGDRSCACVFTRASPNQQGTITREQTFGACSNGRLTWREIFRQ